MGTADMVPGVSGGTVALIAGIYDRLVGAIAALHPAPLRHLLSVHEADSRAAFADAWREMDLTFLLVLGTGMISAVVVLSQLIPIALEEHRTLTGAFFVGLIAASVVLIGTDVPWTRLRAGLATVAAALVVAVATVTVSLADPSAAFVFVAGAIAISAMILPGLSGALLLLILGQYEYLIEQLDAFLSAIVGIATGDAPSTIVEPAVVVVAFCSGAVIGLLTIGRLVDRALERDRATTIAVLVGLMAGGLFPPGRMAVDAASGSNVQIVGAVVVAILGAVIVTAFDYVTHDLEYV
jgi:putative membrane protein